MRSSRSLQVRSTVRRGLYKETHTFPKQSILMTHSLLMYSVKPSVEALENSFRDSLHFFSTTLLSTGIVVRTSHYEVCAGTYSFVAATVSTGSGFALLSDP